jgi:hypothetical protein
MKLDFVSIFAISLLLLPIWAVLTVRYDLEHPELWGDIKHDPRRYGALYAVAFGVTVLTMIPNYRRIKARNRVWQKTMNVVNRLEAAGRRREAQEARLLFLRIVMEDNGREHARLTKQFADRFGL